MGMDMTKAKLRTLTRTAAVRLLVRVVITAADLISRAASVLRTSAIFSDGPLPVCHWSVTIKFPERIKLGEGVVIGPKTTIGAKGGVSLEDHVRISEGVMIESAGLDFGGIPPYPHIAKPIIIERGVWIGARAMILAGVTVGAKSVIGAGVVVTRSVPPGSVVIGARSVLRPQRPPTES